MKNWLTIGQFAKRVSLSQKALRVYEKAGLISAQARGENQYRYYTLEQIEVVENIKLFRSFGFSLAEIRSLLEVDAAFGPEKLVQFLEKRLSELRDQKSDIASAEQKIQTILSSLNQEKPGIAQEERRFIMSQLEKLSVVVTGVSGLERTAHYIASHLASGGKTIPVVIWDGQGSLPSKKPFVLVISEGQLSAPEFQGLSADIVVIKEVSDSCSATCEAYRKLYENSGPHMSTIMNADDRAVIEVAASDFIREGKTYYFSKNSALRPQISRIGGVMSDGETIEIHGFNQSADPVEIKLKRALGHGDEMAYLASLAAIMDLGLKREALLAPR